MNHDDALLREQIVRVSRVDERGPIPEFLAKKDAELAKQTCDGYRYALQRSWPSSARTRPSAT